jgi:hypothetical protein
MVSSWLTIKQTVNKLIERLEILPLHLRLFAGNLAGKYRIWESALCGIQSES